MKKQYESNVYVKFIPKGIEQEEFKKVMAQAGEVISIKLRDMVSKNRATGEEFVNFQSGFVCFSDVKQAQRCIQLFSHQSPFGVGKPLEVDFWQSRDDINKLKEEKSNQSVIDVISMIK